MTSGPSPRASRALPGALVSGAEVIDPDTDSMTVDATAADRTDTVSEEVTYMPLMVITDYIEAKTTTGIVSRIYRPLCFLF